ncbi:MAG: hypothetical protein QOE77_4086 [Blastocatellia bacterium]|nr:hypothetical protein [Blastocatellia bacterium]
MTTDPPPVRGRRRWLVAATVTWAIVLVVLAGQAVRHGRPTVRAQTTIADALPTVDRAIADVADVGAGAGAVAEIGGYRQVDPSCSITLVRDGVRYERGVTLYVPAGREPALLDRINAGLPRGYRSELDRSGDYKLTADAGDFVAVRGSIVGAGQVRVVVETGCRPLSGPVAEESVLPEDSVLPGASVVPGASASPATGRQTASQTVVREVLAILGVPRASWRIHRVACPTGGSVSTLAADGPPGSAPSSLRDRLAGSAPTAVLARADRYVYRSGPVGVVARTDDTAVTVTATTGCR